MYSCIHVAWDRGGGLVNLSGVTTHWHEQLLVVVAKGPRWLAIARTMCGPIRSKPPRSDTLQFDQIESLIRRVRERPQHPANLVKPPPSICLHFIREETLYSSNTKDRGIRVLYPDNGFLSSSAAPSYIYTVYIYKCKYSVVDQETHNHQGITLSCQTFR